MPTLSDFFRNWATQLQSPPNMITAARIVATPYLSVLILDGAYQKALAGCVLAGASDWLDGYIARTYNMKTVLGSYLDPLADKILINTLAVSLWYVGTLPDPLIVLWVGRDCALIGASYWLVRSKTKRNNFVMDPVTTPFEVKPTTMSRVNTGLQFSNLGLGLLDLLLGDSGGTGSGAAGSIVVTSGLLESMW